MLNVYLLVVSTSPRSVRSKPQPAVHGLMADVAQRSFSGKRATQPSPAHVAVDPQTVWHHDGAQTVILMEDKQFHAAG